MNTVVIALLLLAGLSAAACAEKSGDRQHNRQETRPLAFEQIVHERKDGECKGDTTPCISVSVRYPSATAGIDTARRAINDSIAGYVMGTLVGHVTDGATERDGPIDLVIAELFGEYQAFVREAGEDRTFITPWEITIDGKVVYKSAPVITVEISTYSYTGGAHPNYWTAYKNFDPTTGRLLSVESVASDAKKLEALAEKEFRRSNNIGAKADLEKAGYWFSENVFSLPVNFAFTDQGLLFLYNPYEVASYAQGPIDVLLPYSQLKGLLKDGYLP